jgi:hypothetical protein
MKHNRLTLDENLAPDDGRIGYKTPIRVEEINKACNKFLESRGVNTSFFQKNKKKCPTKP